MTKPKETKREAAEFPDPPTDWNPSDFADSHGAWLLGLAELKMDGADDSGPRKTFAIVKRLAWAEHLVGGSVHGWRGRLEAARHHRAQTQGRIGGLERQGRDTTEARGELTTVDKDIAKWAAMISAAEQWPGPDNVTLKARLDQASRRHEEMAARLAPYRRHPEFPVPAGWEEAKYEAEKAVTAAQAAFDLGRARLDKLSALLAKETTKAYDALAGALIHVEDRLGGSCAKIVHDNDPEFLLSFPNRAPDDLIGIYTRAYRVSDLIAKLGGGVHEGMGRFLHACGEVAAEVTCGKLEVRPPLVDTHHRRGSMSQDQIMHGTF